MTIQEAKELLPFFLSGSLSDMDTEEIKLLLETSEELQAELQFCRSARSAVRQQASYLAQGHLTPDEIIEYSIQGYTNSKSARDIVEHLESCTDCNNEITVTKEAYSRSQLRPDAGFLKRTVERLFTLIEPVRIQYAIPIAAAALLLIMVGIKQFFIPGNHPGVTMDRISLALTYTPETRSGEGAQPIAVKLQPATRFIDLSFQVPHPETSIVYRLAIVLPAKDTFNIATTFDARPSSPSFDEIRATLPASIMQNKPGIYRVLIYPDIPNIPPYTYHLNISQ